MTTDSTNPKQAPHPPTYFEAPGGELVARFAHGPIVRVTRSRARAYPGLVSDAPSTLALYELAAAELSGCTRVIDVGCGAGSGLRVLASYGVSVCGVDCDADAVAFARENAEGVDARVADAEELAGIGVHDGAIVVDVLGHVASPFRLLRALHARLAPAGRLVVAEPVAYPAQVLRKPLRRAFSPRGLAAVLAASGFAVEGWTLDDGTFIECVAKRLDDASAMQLAEGSLHAAEGREAEALLAYEAAATSPRPEIRLEALLCLGDLLLGRGDGDGACRAYFAAREVSESDPRPLVGLAQVALGAGEQREALVLARRALALDPSEVSAACALAVVTASIIPDDAFPYFRAASNLAPDSLFIASQLAAVACARGDHDMALYALERVRGYGDDLGAALHVALGNVLLAAGRRADAKLEARLAMARAPGDPEVVRLWSELQ